MVCELYHKLQKPKLYRRPTFLLHPVQYIMYCAAVLDDSRIFVEISAAISLKGKVSSPVITWWSARIKYAAIVPVAII